MVKTLKITGFLAVLAALGCVAMLAMFGLRADPDIQKLLASESIVEMFRKKNTKASSKNEQISPLVKQARALALRINPPPKPKPPGTKKSTKKSPGKSKTIRTPKTPVISTKFKLVATCKYEDQPEKSMALLDLPAKGLKWYRQGQEVNHLVIQQINDRNIVLYKNGAENSVATMPVENKKSLLKSDSAKPAEPVPQLPENSILPTEIIQKLMGQAQKLMGQAKDQETQTPKLPTARPGSRSRGKTASKTVRKKPPTPIPTPKPISEEERKENLENTISNIKRIMSKNKNQSQQETNETFKRLLKTLESEKDSKPAE